MAQRLQPDAAAAQLSEALVPTECCSNEATDAEVMTDLGDVNISRVVYMQHSCSWCSLAVLHERQGDIACLRCLTKASPLVQMTRLLIMPLQLMTDCLHCTVVHRAVATVYQLIRV